MGMGTRTFNWITDGYGYSHVQLDYGWVWVLARSTGLRMGMGTRTFNWISTPMLLGTRSYFRGDLDKGHLPIHPLLPRVPQLDT
jgi:hypothetical protein